MASWRERHDLAARHVADVRLVIDRQRTLIDRQRALGYDTAKSEDLLATFERSQLTFEDDLARIAKERE